MDARSELDPDRREFLVNGMTAGFALAVLPVAAWAVTTSAEGIEAGPVSIPCDGGTMPGYRAMPKGKQGPLPCVLVVHEIFGVHEYIQDVCRRFAKLGYVAVAPDLFFRAGDVSKLRAIDEIRAIVGKVRQTDAMKYLDAALKWAVEKSSADAGRAGVTGFCWGGTITWAYAAHNPKLRAGVAWYGKLASANGGETPIQLAPGLKVPVLGLYGGKDESIPPADVEKMRAALKQGKSGSEIIVYPEAGHAFHADYRPSYHEASARDGWEKAVAWFRKRGLG